MPDNAPTADEKREVLFAAVAVELGRVSAEDMARAQRRVAELARAGQRLRVGEVLLADGLLDKEGALEVLREARLRLGEAPALPGFSVERVLGVGAAGPVFLARQTSLDRPVALRVFSRRIVRDPARLARVEEAARAVARLTHPQLVAGIAYGEAGGYPYFAMEYVDGESLAARLQRERRIPESAAVALARPVAEGFAHAAEHGLSHGALRPSSLLFAADGSLKVADLGSGLPASSDGPAAIYAAPEVRAALAGSAEAAAAFRPGARADIYSLGAILYEAMSGQPWKPRPAADPDPVPLHQLDLAVGRGGSAVVARMLRHRRDDRYADWDEVVADFKQLSENRLPRHAHPAKVFRGESAAQPGAAAAQIRALKEKRSGASWSLPLLLAALAAFVALFFHFGNRGGFSGKPQPPAPFAPYGPDTPAHRARALWREAQDARRAWEKAGGELPSSFAANGQASAAPGDAAADAGATEKPAPRASEPTSAKTARATMENAYAQLLAPEFSTLAYGKAARQQAKELGLSLTPPTPPASPVDAGDAGDAGAPTPPADVAPVP